MEALKFTGDGAQYFKIWIVNILLTVVTLGIYYPWAKVRTRRYFFGNTFLEDANFEYHATGKQLFIGFVISMAFFIAYIFLSNFSPILAMVLMLVLMVATPWIIWRSLKFNHRMISYRNVRFGFGGGVGGAYVVFAYPLALMLGFGLVAGLTVAIFKENIIGFGLVGALSLIFYPVFLAMYNKVISHYFTNGSLFGQGKFSADLKFKPFLMIMLKGLGWGVVFVLIALFAFGSLALIAAFFSDFSFTDLLADAAQKRGKTGDFDSDMEMSAGMGILLVAGLMLLYPLLIAIGFYVSSYLKAQHRRYLFNETTLDDSIRFNSTLEAKPLFQIRITNLLLVMMSAGIAYPWTKVRLHKYLTETIEVEAENGFGGYISQQASEGALGEELGEAFDIDIGGIAF